jgi:hypothetical protein
MDAFGNRDYYSNQGPEIYPRGEGTTNIPPVYGNNQMLPEGPSPYGYYNNNSMMNNNTFGSWFPRFGSALSGYGGSFLGNTYPYSSGSYSAPYGGMYGGWSSPWGGTGGAGGGYPGMNIPGLNNPLVQNIFSPGQNVLATVQNAMQVFARFSGMLEETMRNLHLVFDSIFGLVQILALLKQEVFRFVAPKSSLFQPIVRLVERLMRFWKLFLLFLMSPLAGRYSPVRG